MRGRVVPRLQRHTHATFPRAVKYLVPQAQPGPPDHGRTVPTSRHNAFAVVPEKFKKKLQITVISGQLVLTQTKRSASAVLKRSTRSRLHLPNKQVHGPSTIRGRSGTKSTASYRWQIEYSSWERTRACTGTLTLQLALALTVRLALLRTRTRTLADALPRTCTCTRTRT